MDRVFASLDINLILSNLEAIAGKRVGPQTLLFLDEIQATPHAIESLRYFYEERPALPVIAAGSLLEFALSQAAFSMPVGRIQYLFLQPMSFSEFLEAVDPASMEWLESMSIDAPLPQEAHKRLLNRQRQFLLTGGMPEAVKCFAETQDLAAVASIQNGILNTYVDDFSKYARGVDLADMQRLFRNLPLSLGKKNEICAPAARGDKRACQTAFRATHQGPTGVACLRQRLRRDSSACRNEPPHLQTFFSRCRSLESAARPGLA